MARTLVNSVDITPATTAQIGDVVQSMLTEAEMQSVRGTGWVLMDGRDVTGTKYGILKTGSATIPINIPDARGQFLRGKDHGRHLIDGNGNPDGDQPEGTTNSWKTGNPGFSTNTVGNHSHGYDRVFLTTSSTSMDGIFHNAGGDARYVGRAGSTSGGGGAHSHSISGGNNETAPVNVIVNTFIKIN